MKGQGHAPIPLGSNMSKADGDAFYQQTLMDSLLWGRTVGYPSDSLASCYFSFIPLILFHDNMRYTATQLLLTG